jgi:hypothetical protein
LRIWPGVGQADDVRALFPASTLVHGPQNSALSSLHTSVSAGRATVRSGTSENRQQWLHLISIRSKPPLVANAGSGSDHCQRLRAVSFGPLPSDPAEHRTSVRLPRSLHISPHTCRFKLLGRRDLVLGLSGLQRGRGAAAAEERASNATS